MLCRIRLGEWFRGSLPRAKKRRTREGLTCDAETLESRTLLSAVGAHVPADVEIVDCDDAADTHHDRHLRGAASAALSAIVQHLGEFQLTIVGTAIEYDPHTGLPAHLEGDVFYAGGFLDGRFAGTYQEDLAPVFHPQVPGMFIGTTGVSVFEFRARPEARAPFATLTTHNQSFIVGVDPAGAFLVQSTGTIVSGTGLLRHAAGAFGSASTVRMGTEFAMHTHLTVQFDTDQMRASIRQDLRLWCDSPSRRPESSSHHSGPQWHRNLCDDAPRHFFRVDETRVSNSDRGGRNHQHSETREHRTDRDDDHPRRLTQDRGHDRALDAAFATLGRTWHS